MVLVSGSTVLRSHLLKLATCNVTKAAARKRQGTKTSKAKGIFGILHMKTQVLQDKVKTLWKKRWTSKTSSARKLHPSLRRERGEKTVTDGDAWIAAGTEDYFVMIDEERV